MIWFEADDFVLVSYEYQTIESTKNQSKHLAVLNACRKNSLRPNEFCVTYNEKENEESLISEYIMSAQMHLHPCLYLSDKSRRKGESLLP